MTCNHCWRSPHAFARCVLVLLLDLLGAELVVAADSDTKRFNVPVGVAEQTLKQFSAQSGVQLAYPTDLVQGVRTNAIQGDYQPVEALEKMVAGTPLRVVRDEKPGAFAIKLIKTIKRDNDPKG